MKANNFQISTMKNSKPSTDVDQVLATIDQVLKENREKFRPEEWTAAERAEAMQDIHKIITEAHKLKLKIKIDQLAAKQPDLSPRKVVVKLLTTLPEDLPASAISELAGYAAMEWERKVGLVAV
jgi:hypothetical protein